MDTPFTIDQFYDVFEKYNIKVFPAQLLLFSAGLFAVFSLHLKTQFLNRVIGSVLGLLWIWTALIYHMIFFSEINQVAFVFGALFLVEGILILRKTFSKTPVEFGIEGRLSSRAGYLFILFGLIIYPLVGFCFDGTMLARTISLGLPCPTTIFTLGFLMVTTKPIPIYLLIIPSLWSIVGLSAALNFGIYQDFMMILSAMAANIAVIKRTKEAAITKCK